MKQETPGSLEGMHENTAFGLFLMHDFAIKSEGDTRENKFL